MAPRVRRDRPGSCFARLHAIDPDLVVQVNHPRSTGGIGYFEVMSFDPSHRGADPRFSSEFDALEVFNGFDLGQRANVDRVFDDWLAVGSRANAWWPRARAIPIRFAISWRATRRTYVAVPELDRQDSGPSCAPSRLARRS